MDLHAMLSLVLFAKSTSVSQNIFITFILHVTLFSKSGKGNKDLKQIHVVI